jgi:hypothetical protein
MITTPTLLFGEFGADGYDYEDITCAEYDYRMAHWGDEE